MKILGKLDEHTEYIPDSLRVVGACGTSLVSGSTITIELDKLGTDRTATICISVKAKDGNRSDNGSDESECVCACGSKGNFVHGRMVN